MPCSGPRRRVPVRKPSLLQYQNVQNQTNRIVACHGTWRKSSTGVENQSERHLVRDFQGRPVLGDLVRDVRIEAVLAVHRERCLGGEQRPRWRAGDEGHLESLLGPGEGLLELEAHAEAAVPDVQVEYA